MCSLGAHFKVQLTGILYKETIVISDILIAVSSDSEEDSSSSRIVDVVSVATLLGFWISFIVQKSPYSFFVYIVFPIYFWREVVRVSGGSVFAVDRLKGRVGVWGVVKTVVRLGLIVGALQSMVVSVYSPRLSRRDTIADVFCS